MRPVPTPPHPSRKARRLPLARVPVPWRAAPAPVEYRIGDHVVLVDPLHAWMLDKWSWNLTRDGYVFRSTSIREPGNRYPRNVKVYLHREIMGLRRHDGLEVDHRNTDPLDNRITNLRVVTPSENKTICRIENKAALEAPA